MAGRPASPDNAGMTDAEKRAAYAKDWYARNRERVLKMKAEQRAAEPERIRERERQWTKKNPARYRAKVVRACAALRAKSRIRIAARPPRADHAAFDTVTPESAYWVGFLMADGCVTDHGSVRLSLALRDFAHVEKFAQFLKVNRAPIVSGDNAVLSVDSKPLAAALARFGVVPRKTHAAKVIGLEHNRDFWRGSIDGDGSVHLLKREPVGYPYLNHCGSLDMMNQFRDYVAGVNGGRQVTVHKMKSIWSVTIGGNYAVPVLRAMYNDCAVALDRKLERARQAIAFPFRRAAAGPHQYKRTSGELI